MAEGDSKMEIVAVQPGHTQVLMSDSKNAPNSLTSQRTKTYVHKNDDTEKRDYSFMDSLRSEAAREGSMQNFASKNNDFENLKKM